MHFRGVTCVGSFTGVFLYGKYHKDFKNMEHHFNKLNHTPS